MRKNECRIGKNFPEGRVERLALGRVGAIFGVFGLAGGRKERFGLVERGGKAA